jgi:hypothetical protein
LADSNPGLIGKRGLEAVKHAGRECIKTAKVTDDGADPEQVQKFRDARVRVR